MSINNSGPQPTDFLLTRSNHTGTQPITSIDGLTTLPTTGFTTGTGNLVLQTSPTLVTPTLGVATVTSVNKVTVTAPATSAVLTIADGKTLTCSNTLTFTGTDSSSVAFSTGGTVAYLDSPSFTTPVLGVATATSINKVTITAPATSAVLTIADGKTLTCSNTLTFTGTDSSSVAFGTGGTVLYSAGVLTSALGTVSAPGLTFTGDTNTGVYSSDADTINVTTAGAEKARIDSAGVLWILDGITAPGASVSGMAGIFVDTADGDLKVRFADGTVKVIVADT